MLITFDTNNRQDILVFISPWRTANQVFVYPRSACQQPLTIVVEGSIYFYAPVKWAPPMFAAWFLVATGAHIWQCIHYRAWKVTGLHPLCAMMFTVGFALRSYDAFDYGNVDTYIASTIFIYCAP